MLAASVLLLTIGQLEQPFTLLALDSSARVSTRASDFLRGPVEEVASQADLGSTNATISDSAVPIELENELAHQIPSFEFEETDRPAKQVFHRRILPPSPNDDR